MDDIAEFQIISVVFQIDELTLTFWVHSTQTGRFNLRLIPQITGLSGYFDV